jgi:hypothetical protein
MPIDDLSSRAADGARSPMAPREAAWRGRPVPADYREHAAKLSRRWRITGTWLLLLAAGLALALIVGIVAGAGGGEPFALVLAVVMLLLVGSASAWLLRIGRRGERLYGSGPDL